MDPRRSTPELRTEIARLDREILERLEARARASKEIRSRAESEPAPDVDRSRRARRAERRCQRVTCRAKSLYAIFSAHSRVGARARASAARRLPGARGWLLPRARARAFRRGRRVHRVPVGARGAGRSRARPRGLRRISLRIVGRRPGAGLRHRADRYRAGDRRRAHAADDVSAHGQRRRAGRPREGVHDAGRVTPRVSASWTRSCRASA